MPYTNRQQMLQILVNHTITIVHFHKNHVDPHFSEIRRPQRKGIRNVCRGRVSRPGGIWFRIALFPGEFVHVSELKRNRVRIDRISGRGTRPLQDNSIVFYNAPELKMKSEE